MNEAGEVEKMRVAAEEQIKSFSARVGELSQHFLKFEADYKGSMTSLNLVERRKMRLSEVEQEKFLEILDIIGGLNTLSRQAAKCFSDLSPIIKEIRDRAHRVLQIVTFLTETEEEKTERLKKQS